MNEINTIHISPEEMRANFTDILISFNFSAEDAKICAEIFTQNSVDGVYSHGVNRFPRFIDYIKKGLIFPKNKPSLKNKIGVIEQWEGALAPGPLNAVFATDKALEIAKESGIGCVALSNTNHWMRGGYYGWHAAKKEHIFIGWTNTTSIMPAWGAADPKLGNNPLVMAIPYHNEAIVLDMSMSQFSYGAMELAELKNEKLKVNGGYDDNGNLTNDPGAILKSMRTLPVGFWKGSSLSFVLDVLATILSDGLAVHQVAKKEEEISCSQVFIAINPKKLNGSVNHNKVIDQIIEDLKRSIPINNASYVRYPGERAVENRISNTAKGIPVLIPVWKEIKSFLT